MPRNVTTYLIFNPFILRQAQDERIKNKVGCHGATSAYVPRQGQIFPFVVSKIFARRSKGVGKKQGLWLLFGVRLMAFISLLWLFLPLIYMTKKAVS
ncbi:MAG: hypothetical protein WC091_09365 [Sulfuricellaceae bacterium]